MSEVITNSGVTVELRLAQKVHMEAVREAMSQNDVEQFNKLWYGKQYSEPVHSG